MVIEVLSQNYNCQENSDNCKGMSIYKKDQLLFMLNLVIEWDKSKFPIKLKDGADPEVVESYEEDKKFLGDDPLLRPGNMFLYDGQVFGINSSSEIVLGVSETGPGAARRFVEDILIPEFELANNFDVDKVSYNELSSGETETKNGNYTVLNVKNSIMEIFNNKFKEGRFPVDTYLEVTIEDSELIFQPVKLIFNKWNVFYESSYIDEDYAKDLVYGTIAWFYRETDRI